MILQKLNPAVDKKYLIMLAGIMWCGVGIMLILFAASWLHKYNGKGTGWYYLAGFHCSNADSSFRISAACR